MSPQSSYSSSREKQIALYPWGVLVPNPASLAALSLNRAIYLNSKNKDILVKKRDEQLLIEQCIPNSKEWAGTSGFEHFNKYIYTSGHYDDGLSPIQQAESLALISLVRDKLLPAVLFFQWMEEENYNDVTYPYVAELAGFGKGWILPGLCKRAVTDEMTAILSYSNGGVDPINKSINHEQMKNCVLKSANEAIRTLSNRLKHNNQAVKISTGFYGSQNITSVDCLVYGYLASIIGAPWKNTSLKDILLKQENQILVSFVDDMSSKLFPEVPKPSSTGLNNSHSVEPTQKAKIMKRAINAGIVLFIMGFIVSRSAYSPLIKIHVKSFRTYWSSFLNWMYPSTKTKLKSDFKVMAPTERSQVIDEISKFEPKKGAEQIISALG